MILDAVAADADHLDPLFAQRFQIVAKGASLLGAAAGHVAGIEVDDDDLLADVIGRLPRLALIVDAFEDRSCVADVEHDLAAFGVDGTGVLGPGAAEGQEQRGQNESDSLARIYPPRNRTLFKETPMNFARTESRRTGSHRMLIIGGGGNRSRGSEYDVGERRLRTLDTLDELVKPQLALG
jgi:hypothetical protein